MKYRVNYRTRQQNETTWGDIYFADVETSGDIKQEFDRIFRACFACVFEYEIVRIQVDWDVDAAIDAAIEQYKEEHGDMEAVGHLFACYMTYKAYNDNCSIAQKILENLQCPGDQDCAT